MPGRAGAELLAVAREAFTNGMQTAALTGAVLLLAAAALAAATLQGIRMRDTQE
jgi:DHA2 family multidrug resistance protein-like MFS transporter